MIAISGLLCKLCVLKSLALSRLCPQGLDYEGWPNGPFGKAAGKPDGWFTEGHDMHDLKEAKASLNELHA
jgi:hypothetical protein